MGLVNHDHLVNDCGLKSSRAMLIIVEYSQTKYDTWMDASTSYPKPCSLLNLQGKLGNHVGTLWWWFKNWTKSITQDCRNLINCPQLKNKTFFCSCYHSTLVAFTQIIFFQKISYKKIFFEKENLCEEKLRFFWNIMIFSFLKWKLQN